MSKSTLEQFLEATTRAYTNESRLYDYDEGHAAIGSHPYAEPLTLGDAQSACNDPPSVLEFDSGHDDPGSTAPRTFGEKIQEKEKVNHPDHYNKGIETIDYIESWNMNFAQGNVVKYVSRYSMKGGLEDLRKAKWYLDRLIELEEKNG